MNVTELHEIAEGLNIEGGFPGLDLRKVNKLGIWVNLVLVLDRPLIDNIVFDDLLKNNPYPLLENAIDEINEYKMFACYIMIVGYYLELAKETRKKITIHVHQDGNLKSCQELVKIIKKHVDDLVIQFGFGTVPINYLTDDLHYQNVQNTKIDYSNTDILISLSQCAGLDADIPAGILMIPADFVPYDIDNKTIELSSKYEVDNDLIDSFLDIMESVYKEYAIEYINKNYKSANLNKKNILAGIVPYDFYCGTILQVNKLWNPTDKTEMLKIT